MQFQITTGHGEKLWLGGNVPDFLQQNGPCLGPGDAPSMATGDQEAKG
jgi:hypothetical protein